MCFKARILDRPNHMLAKLFSQVVTIATFRTVSVSFSSLALDRLFAGDLPLQKSAAEQSQFEAYLRNASTRCEQRSLPPLVGLGR